MAVPNSALDIACQAVFHEWSGTLRISAQGKTGQAEVNISHNQWTGSFTLEARGAPILDPSKQDFQVEQEFDAEQLCVKVLSARQITLYTPGWPLGSRSIDVVRTPIDESNKRAGQHPLDRVATILEESMSDVGEELESVGGATGYDLGEFGPAMPANLIGCLKMAQVIVRVHYPNAEPYSVCVSPRPSYAKTNDWLTRRFGGQKISISFIDASAGKSVEIHTKGAYLWSAPVEDDVDDDMAFDSTFDLDYLRLHNLEKHFASAEHITKVELTRSFLTHGNDWIFNDPYWMLWTEDTTDFGLVNDFCVNAITEEVLKGVNRCTPSELKHVAQIIDEKIDPIAGEEDGVDDAGPETSTRADPNGSTKRDIETIIAHKWDDENECWLFLYKWTQPGLQESYKWLTPCEDDMGATDIYWESIGGRPANPGQENVAADSMFVKALMERFESLEHEVRSLKHQLNGSNETTNAATATARTPQSWSSSSNGDAIVSHKDAILQGFHGDHAPNNSERGSLALSVHRREATSTNIIGGQSWLRRAGSLDARSDGNTSYASTQSAQTYADETEFVAVATQPSQGSHGGTNSIHHDPTNLDNFMWSPMSEAASLHHGEEVPPYGTLRVVKESPQIKPSAMTSPSSEVSHLSRSMNHVSSAQASGSAAPTYVRKFQWPSPAFRHGTNISSGYVSSHNAPGHDLGLDARRGADTAYVSASYQPYEAPRRVTYVHRQDSSTLCPRQYKPPPSI